MLEMTARDEAARLWEEGLTVVPAHPQRKHPVVPWARWQNEAPPDNLVEEWLHSDRYLHCNYAIITGPQITVVDADSSEAEEWITQNLLFTPRTVKTSRGRHYYFQANPNLTIRNSVNADAKIDIRGAGGIVIAPGSVHESGAIYTEQLTDGFDCAWHDLPMLSDGDLQNIQQYNNGAPGSFDTSETGVVWGARNDGAARVAGSMINRGHSLDETIDHLTKWNMNNEPPLSRGELRQTVNSIWSTHGRKSENQLVEMKDRVEQSRHGLEPRAFSITDFSAIPKREWVYGNHFIRKFISVTVAGGGTGKTALTLCEAVAMASGRNLLGIETEKRKVWVWNLEDPYEELQRRIAAIMIFYGIKNDEINDSLFVNSGRDERLVITEEINGHTVASPIVDLMIEFINRAQIDVIIIDPFVSTHNASENDNAAIDAVVKSWGRIADAANCAVEIVHHTRKAQPNRNGVSFDDARGASSLTDAARHVRRLVKMSPDEARLADIDEDQAWRYTREADSKDNLAPPTQDNSWREMKSVDLPNGDNVQVVAEWHWPDPFADVSTDDLLAVKRALSGLDYRWDARAKDWCGKVVADVLELDAADKGVKGKVKMLLQTWVKNDQFEVFTLPDPKTRQRREFIRPIFESITDVPF